LSTLVDSIHAIANGPFLTENYDGPLFNG